MNLGESARVLNALIKPEWDSFHQLIQSPLGTSQTFVFKHADPCRIEFEFAGYTFCLCVEHRLSVGVSFLCTYRMEIDKDDFPKTKLVHIEDLDVIVFFNSFKKFAKRPSYIKESLQIFDSAFGRRYSVALHNYVAEIEKPLLAEIELITKVN